MGVWVAAAVPWLGLAVITALARDTENGAELAGRIVGAALFSLLIALALRWLYTKAGGGRVWSPWVLVIACMVGLVAAGGAVAGSDDDDDGSPPPELANPRRHLGELPPGYRYEPSPVAVRRQMRGLLTSVPDASGFLARDVVGRGRLQGRAVVITADEEVDDEKADFAEGFESASGRPMREITLGGEEAFTGTLPGPTTVVARVYERAMVIVYLSDRLLVRSLGAAILTR
jgi:hypothetical protein